MKAPFLESSDQRMDVDLELLRHKYVMSLSAQKFNLEFKCLHKCPKSSDKHNHMFYVLMILLLSPPSSDPHDLRTSITVGLDYKVPPTEIQQKKNFFSFYGPRLQFSSERRFYLHLPEEWSGGSPSIHHEAFWSSMRRCRKRARGIWRPASPEGLREGERARACSAVTAADHTPDNGNWTSPPGGRGFLQVFAAFTCSQVNRHTCTVFFFTETNGHAGLIPP